jgi:hypothetical protein
MGKRPNPDIREGFGYAVKVRREELGLTLALGDMLDFRPGRAGPELKHVPDGCR